ncbi:unnamed protein product [Bemisia tabaci]|uniref:Aminopeptidase n=1 Tax=Bemisia tabaci TaxID=7038 RepID=A0A9P0AL57_BEMTA|nr:unnamed protein product [Bemisia tabaci]
MVQLLLYISMGWILGQATGFRAPQPYRLDGSVVPYHYDLFLEVNLDPTGLHDEKDYFKFRGYVKIKMACKETTNKIVLHARNLTIFQSYVRLNELSSSGLESNRIMISDHSHNLEYEQLIVETESELAAGKNYSYKLPFFGKLRKDRMGLYRAFYRDSNNVTRPLAVTQFEPTYARRAFPCFDEPHMKATFTLTIQHCSKYTALSNMPLVDQVPVRGKVDWVRDRFAESLPMSTYLVAFVVSDFAHDEIVRSKSGVEIRVWARPNHVERNLTKFASNYAPKVLDYFEKYFDMKYPLPKLDMVAIPPRYFPVGGMENWGLVTFSESSFLLEESATKVWRVASIITHEIAHQWVGNLVTMKWWSDLWLNEGLASYFHIFATDAMNPEWNVQMQSQIEDLTTTWQKPGPVRASVSRPEDFIGLFGPERYKKGMFMIRMIGHFLGMEILRAGLMHYMKRHQYGNVVQDDLWTALTEVAHENGVLDPKTSVKTIMDPWTTQTGYPVLDVKKNSNGTLTLSQRMFDPKCVPSKTTAKNGSTYWPIPITYTTGKIADFSNTKPGQWLTGEQNPMISDIKVAARDWIVFNLQVAALYKVNYYEENWELLKGALETRETREKIHPLNREQIYRDALDFGWSQELDYKLVFSLCASLRHETDYLPLSGALASLRQLDLVLRRSPNHAYFKNYLQKLMNPIVKESGSLAETPIEARTIEKQSLMAEVATHFKIGNYERQALYLFANWSSSLTPDSVIPIPRNVLRQVCCIALKKRGAEVWDFLWKRYRNSVSAPFKSIILSSLTCSNKVGDLEQYLEWVYNRTSEVRPTESLTLFEAVADNEVGFDVAKDFFMKRVSDIFAYHGAKKSEMGRYVEILADQMVTTAEYDEMKAFIEKYDGFFKFSVPAVERALDKIDTNIGWHSVHCGKLVEYLAPALQSL